MKYTTFSETELKISQIGLGTWVFSGKNWGGSQEKECISAVHAALDHGINLIDTAPIYGYGLAETIVGKAIQSKREQVIVATKCGLVGRGKEIAKNLTPENITQELHDSLNRLQTEYIDIYQCHWPDPNTPIQATMECLKKFQDQGKIRHIGVSNFEIPIIKEAMKSVKVQTLQSQLSILTPQLRDEILPFCKDQGIGVLAYGPLAGGILTGKYKAPKTFSREDVRSFFYQFYQGEKFKQVRCFLDEIEALNKPLDQIAVNWVRRQTAVAAVLVGARNPAQVIRNAQAADWDLTDVQMKFIEERMLQVFS